LRLENPAPAARRQAHYVVLAIEKTAPPRVGEAAQVTG
jgi:hypothetical protein